MALSVLIGLMSVACATSSATLEQSNGTQSATVDLGDSTPESTPTAEPNSSTATPAAPSPTAEPTSPEPPARPVGANPTQAPSYSSLDGPGGYLSAFSTSIGATNIVDQALAFAPDFPEIWSFPDDAVLTGISLDETIGENGEGRSGVRLHFHTAAFSDDLEAFYLATMEASGFSVDGQVRTTSTPDGRSTKFIGFASVAAHSVDFRIVSMRTEPDGDLTEVVLYTQWITEPFSMGLLRLAGDFPMTPGLELQEVRATIFASLDRYPVFLEWKSQAASTDLGTPTEISEAVAAQLPTRGWDLEAPPRSPEEEFGVPIVITPVRSDTFAEPFEMKVGVDTRRTSIEVLGRTTAEVADFALPLPGEFESPEPTPTPAGAADVGTLPFEGESRPVVAPDTLATGEGIEAVMRSMPGATNIMDHVAALDPLFDTDLPLPDDAVLVKFTMQQFSNMAHGIDYADIANTTVRIASAASVNDLEAFYLATMRQLGYEELGEVSTRTSDDGSIVREIDWFPKDRGALGEVRVDVEIMTADGYTIVTISQQVEHTQGFPGPASAWVADAPRPDGWQLGTVHIVIGGERQTGFGLLGQWGSSFAGPIDASPEGLTAARDRLVDQLPAGPFLGLAGDPRPVSEDGGYLGFEIEHEALGSITTSFSISGHTEAPGSLTYTAQLQA